MIRLAQFIAIAAFFAITQVASAQAILLPGQAPCQYNCVQLQRVGDSLVATLFDRTGAPVKVITHELDANAGKLSHVTNSNNNKSAQVGTLSMAGTTQTTTTTYTTATEVVIVTIPYVYDSKGGLVDVRFFELRYPRARIEK